ncbi:carbonic anhydrase 9 [Centroberyx affinis]|uniref:carbonic anhydrase 9 n=1 Tax=Centroberyx affinis TaxID=166261 RepID=UPI003A5BE560
MRLKIFTLLFLHDVLLNASCSSSSSEESEELDSGENNNNNQKAWSTAFHQCSGKSQSPINIDTKAAIYDRSLPLITLDGYDLTDGPGLTLLNNGHTLQLILPSTMRIVTGFDTVYHAAQLHFHWGTVEVPGSEHTVDNVHFPAEIHVVHYNSKYASVSEAASKPDGLVVLGGFIGVGLHENDNYEKILSGLTDVSIEESNTEILGFNIRHLLPKNLDKFYRYTGSLTTPPCYQTVNWTLFNDTITVSRRQLAALEDTLKVGQLQHLNKNFRAPQLLHGRTVLASFTASQILGEGLSKGDILAIAFGVLFAATLLFFAIYRYQQRTKYSSVTKVSRQNVIYMQANKEEI